MLNLDKITRSKSGTRLPEHHVASAGSTEAASGWASYISSWAPSPGRSRPSLSEARVAGFRNPWPSWHRPTLAEKWNSFRWGEDDDGCVELAASHLADCADDAAQPQDTPRNMRPSFADTSEGPDSIGVMAARLLRVETPDFSFMPGTKAKATWLGHAGVLVQLPPLGDGTLGRPVRALFDPLFGDRCSPSRFAGPIRSYPPPCRAQDLPPIDLVLISHNHFDHMDAGSIQSVWDHSRDTVRFFVPLGNAKYLLGWGIPADRVVELDWWDSADLTCGPTSAVQNESTSSNINSTTLRVHCTPAQHNSFRSFGDTNAALWSSWLLELAPATRQHHRQDQQQRQPYRVFFAGDTGYQFHPDPSWPPSPNNPGGDDDDDDDDEAPGEAEGENGDDEEGGRFPACPAFAQIRARIGAPHLLLLPVSVGATFSYLRSFFAFSLAGVTGANHMPPWDAVRVLRVMAGPPPPPRGQRRRRRRRKRESSRSRRGDEEEEGGPGDDDDDGGVGGGDGDGDGGDGAVAVAMHWGTFVPDPEEVLRTLGALEWACQRQGVRFARELRRAGGEREQGPGLAFVAPHHGASVVV
ncbi:hypothetical protein VTH06DRAFT_7663 [Thermothelomyces fergusii]